MVQWIGVLACFVLFVGSSGKYQEAPQPEINYLSKKTHDMGTVKAEEAYSDSFRFVNKGDGPLHIERVKTACKCLTPSWPKALVQPGDTASIKVEFFPTQKGDFFKSVQVHTNLPKRSLQLLYVKGVVVEE